MAKAVIGGPYGGQGTYGPLVAYGPGISPLWSYMRMPPAWNSIIIYNDGTVKEQAHFDNSDVTASNVHTFILGGTRFQCDVGSFEYNALVAAGYSVAEVPEADTYTDDYQDVY